ncbi:MAG: hypothetical protein ACC653_08320 [Gammaproteobacteria bacterium]
MFKSKFIFIVISFLLVLTSCSTVDPMQALGYTWRAYERTIRWDDISGAVHFLKEDAVSTSKFPKEVKNLKVTGYDVIRKSINDDDMIATQEVKIRFYNVNDFIEKSFIDKQEWKFDEKNNRWYLSSKLLKFPIEK